VQPVSQGALTDKSGCIDGRFSVRHTHDPRAELIRHQFGSVTTGRVTGRFDSETELGQSHADKFCKSDLLLFS
jgi:hypothetical protein